MSVRLSSKLGTLVGSRSKGGNDLFVELEAKHWNGSVKKKDRKEEYAQYYLKNKDRKSDYYRRLRIKGNLTKETVANYALQNKDKLKEYYRLNYSRNNDRMNESSTRYCLQNKDRMKELWMQYYLRNKDKRKDSSMEYNRQTMDKRKEYRRLRFVSRRKIYQSWDTPEKARQYFDSIALKLNITNFADWYRISRDQISSVRGM